MTLRPIAHRFGTCDLARTAGHVCVALLVSCAASDAIAVERELLVFGATSLRNALPEIGDAYTRRTPGVRIRLHTAGSTTLRRQIDSGAPADVFIGADALDMQQLESTGAVSAPSSFAANELVIATRTDTAARDPRARLFDSPGLRIAIGNPRTAPVGRYTQQVLAALRPPGATDPQRLLCENARQITSALASGACDVAIAYRTDVLADGRLRIAWTFADSLHAPIRYQAAALTRTNQREDAVAFVRFLSSEPARAILLRHAFVPMTLTESAATPTHHNDPVALQTVRRPRLEPLWLSLRVATLATLWSGLAGLALAAWLARARAGLRRDVIAAITDLPLVLPPTVIGLLLLEICGPRGVIGAVLENAGLRVAFTWSAAVLASATMAAPLMVRTARAALESVPARYLESARTLGATPWSAFWRIQLPLARRGVAAGLVLCFFRALGEFGATLMVAGNIPGHTQTLPLAIYTSVFEGRPRDAALWVILVLVLSWVGALSAQTLARTPGR